MDGLGIPFHSRAFHPGKGSFFLALSGKMRAQFILRRRESHLRSFSQGIQAQNEVGLDVPDFPLLGPKDIQRMYVPLPRPGFRGLPIPQRTAALGLAMNPTRQVLGFHLRSRLLRPVGAALHAACRVVRRKQLVNHLAVVHGCVCQPVTPNQLVSTVNVDVVLVAKSSRMK